MRIGTWNLWRYPTPTSTRGPAIADWLTDQAVDLWLLTEVHRDGDPRGRRLIVSPSRRFGSDAQRWAGIETSLPLHGLRTVCNAQHPGEEGLVLARVQLDASAPSTALVACSVLPWTSPGDLWPGLPSGGHATHLRHVLDHHVARIKAERMDGEPLIWGGDFNQQLTQSPWAGTVEGASALRAAFDKFHLVVLTERAEHLIEGSSTIDHLAVSPELVADAPVAAVHRPTPGGAKLSDHAAYTAELRLPAPAAVPAGALAGS